MASSILKQNGTAAQKAQQNKISNTTTKKTTTKSAGAGTNNEWSTRTTALSNNVNTSNANTDRSGGNGGSNSGSKRRSSTNTTTNATPTTTENTSVSEAYFSPYDDYEDDSDSIKDYVDALIAYQEKQSAAALAAQQAAIQAGRDQSVNTLNAQKTSTEQEYADLYRQLYIDSMKSKKNIDQQMAAQGLTGGQSESTLLGLDTAYAEGLNSGKQAEQSAYNDIENAIANAQLAASADEATAIAENAATNASNYTSAMQSYINQLATERANRISAANSQASENRQYAYTLATSLLSAGQMPDDTTLAAAGISKTDAAKLLASVNSSSSGSSGGSGSNSNNSYKLINSSTGTATNTGTSAGAGTNNEYSGIRNYDVIRSTASGYKASGYTNSQINSYLNEQYNKGYITNAQKQYIASYLGI